MSCRDEYSLVVREIEKDLLPAAREYKLGLLPFFPLAGATRVEHVEQNVKAIDWILSAEEIAEIDKITKG